MPHARSETANGRSGTAACARRNRRSASAVTGLDTNVLVRYIMQDEPAQSAKATALIESLTAADPGFIPLVCVVELYWVLTSCYTLSDSQVVSALEALVRTK